MFTGQTRLENVLDPLKKRNSKKEIIFSASLFAKSKKKSNKILGPNQKFSKIKWYYLNGSRKNRIWFIKSRFKNYLLKILMFNASSVQLLFMEELNLWNLSEKK